VALPASARHANARERRQALLDAEEYIRAHIWRLEDDSINALYSQYTQAYQTMLAALESVWRNSVEADVWTASDAKFQARLNTLMGAIENEVQRLGKNSSDFALEQAAAAWRGGFFGRAYTLTVAQRGGVSEMPRLPTEAIRAQLLLPYEGGTFLTRFEDARDEFVSRLRRSLIQSQINGESIRDAQKRIAEALGIDIGRRTKAARQANEGLFAKTEMIARTEILRASNLGANAIYRARSPIHAIDRLACPLILFQGLEDKVVPPNQSQMMADAVRAKGLPVAYLAFEGEQHGFRKADTIIRSLEAELYFYGKVFGFTPADVIEPVPIDNL